MSRSEADSVVITQSVLDRLIDREPQVQVEGSTTRAQSLRMLKASLRRDLEWLLNTRRTPEEAGDDMHELSRSMFNYGFPDFSNFSLANPKDRLRMLRALEGTIELFEPRLMAVRIVPVEAETVDTTRMIRFQIEGLLKIDPAPEQVTFDTVLSLTSGEYQVKGERSAG
jgi:type VI secretion system protein ImpF